MNSLRTKRIEILQGMQGTKIRTQESCNHIIESQINTTYPFILYKLPVKVVYGQFVVCIKYIKRYDSKLLTKFVTDNKINMYIKILFQVNLNQKKERGTVRRS